MAKQSIVLRLQNPRSQNHPAPEFPAKSSRGFARPEVVARALGYTDREQAIARDVLNQFVWRQAAQPPDQDTSGEEDERTLDDLEAAS
jgi:hypothetical protein